MARSQDAVTARILFNGRDLPRTVPVMNISHFVPNLSGGNLFTNWVTMVASLESECWVYSRMPLSFSSGLS